MKYPTPRPHTMSALLIVLLGLATLAPSGARNAQAQTSYTPADGSLASYARNVLNRFAQYKGQYWVAGQQEVHWDSARKDEMSNAAAPCTTSRAAPRAGPAATLRPAPGR